MTRPNTPPRASTFGLGDHMIVPRPAYDDVCKGAGGHLLGPHNRCAHMTAIPPGSRRCPEPGCPFRLPARVAACPWHGDSDGDAHRRYEELMGK